MITTTEFISNLDGWLFDNSEKYGDFIFKNLSQVPPMFKSYSGILYRGMILDQETLENFNKGIKFDRHSSWSKNKNVSIKFMNDPKFKTGSKNGIPVLLQKKVTKSIPQFDIHQLTVMFSTDQLVMMGMDDLNAESAEKEYEVILKAGLKISPKEILLKF